MTNDRPLDGFRRAAYSSLHVVDTHSQQVRLQQIAISFTKGISEKILQKNARCPKKRIN
jgi:hypothetical protein